MSEQTIGTCSLCGGPVRVPADWWGINPPTPTCAKCGATKRGHGPVIDMEKAPKRTSTSKLRFMEFVEDTAGSRFVVTREEPLPDPLRRWM